MMQKLASVFVVVCMATQVDARQFLGRGGNVAPVDLTNSDIMKPLKPGHGIVVNRDHSYGD